MLNLFRLTILVVLVSVASVYLINISSEEQESRIRRAIIESDKIENKCKQPGLFVFAFDEGPSTFTLPILSALRAENVTATFYVATKQIESTSGKATLKKAFDEGHEIGLRFPPNVDPRELNETEFIRLIYDESEKIHQQIGKYPKFLRLPFEQWEPRTLNLASKMGMVSGGWNIDAKDFAIAGVSSNSEGMDKVVNYVIDKIEGRSLDTESFISLHRDIYSLYSNDNMLRRLIQKITQNGFRIVSMNQCLAIQPYRKFNTDLRAIDLDIDDNNWFDNSFSENTGNNGPLIPMTTSDSEGDSTANAFYSLLSVFLVVQFL